MNTNRHRWKQDGHPYNHKKVCTKCGCIKDSSSLSITRYTLNGVVTQTAPECIEQTHPLKIYSKGIRIA